MAQFACFYPTSIAPSAPHGLFRRRAFHTDTEPIPIGDVGLAVPMARELKPWDTRMDARRLDRLLERLDAGQVRWLCAPSPGRLPGSQAMLALDRRGLAWTDGSRLRDALLPELLRRRLEIQPSPQRAMIIGADRTALERWLPIISSQLEELYLVQCDVGAAQAWRELLWQDRAVPAAVLSQPHERLERCNLLILCRPLRIRLPAGYGGPVVCAAHIAGPIPRSQRLFTPALIAPENLALPDAWPRSALYPLAESWARARLSQYGWAEDSRPSSWLAALESDGFALQMPF